MKITVQPGRYLWECANAIGCVMGIVLLSGCSSPLKIESDAGRVEPKPNSYPESVLSGLSHETFTSVQSYSTKVTVPESTPFESNRQLSQLYYDWYRTGYAFAYVTGLEHMQDWAYHEDQAERAKLAGWFDGNSAGGSRNG